MSVGTGPETYGMKLAFTSIVQSWQTAHQRKAATQGTSDPLLCVPRASLYL